MPLKEILRHAKEVIRIEAEAVEGLLDRIDESFVRAVETILSCKGRVVVTGIGKSGLVGRKIVATLISTGTPAAFLHPVEGLHGDLGMVSSQDILLAISNSGETAEILTLLPSIQKIGAPVITLTGNLNSTLARSSQVAIDAGVEREACPLGLAPTSSTTAALVIGDALAVALMRQKKFEEKDFALFHPGGSLGERTHPAGQRQHASRGRGDLFFSRKNRGRISGNPEFSAKRLRLHPSSRRALRGNGRGPRFAQGGPRLPSISRPADSGTDEPQPPDRGGRSFGERGHAAHG